MTEKLIHFETLGCRLNQDETEGAARVFSISGFIPDMEAVMARTEVNERVLLSIINTCTVTSKAEQKARRLMRLMAEKYPKAPVLVTGCYAELDIEEICNVVPGRICVLPGSKKFLLSQIAKEMAEGELSVDKGLFNLENLSSFISKKVVEFENVNQRSLSPVAKENSTSSLTPALDSFTLYTPLFEKHSRASIKIEDGCNNNCAYCRIHLARGKAVSLDVEKVVERVKDLEKQGAREVVFTGVNLSQYAGLKSDGGRASFNELLKILLAETSRIKFRVSSFYPQHITPELCETLKDERVQPSFHLSIQSGSDRILDLMKRPYKVESVLRAARLLREAKGNPFISCDIIAGFPGEMEEDFEETRKMCNEIQFGWIHAFPFSPRPGTAAYTMKPQIPERIKDERVKWLTQTAIQGKLDYIKSYQGKVLSAIVENSRSQRRQESKKRTLHAVTENFLHVECVLSDEEQTYVPGSVVYVKLLEPLEENIRGGKEIECTGILSME